MVETFDEEVKKIEAILYKLSELSEELRDIKDQDTWYRIRNYINERQEIDLPYYHPFLIEEKNKKK